MSRAYYSCCVVLVAAILIVFNVSYPKVTTECPYGHSTTMFLHLCPETKLIITQTHVRFNQFIFVCTQNTVEPWSPWAQVQEQVAALKQSAWLASTAQVEGTVVESWQHDADASLTTCSNITWCCSEDKVLNGQPNRSQLTRLQTASEVWNQWIQGIRQRVHKARLQLSLPAKVSLSQAS